MCLLIVLSRVHRDAPLVVAANRDELVARPAISMTVLEEGIVGGRDLLAGGTWLALSRHGVFAGLTNLPSTQVPRSPARRSRGELPLVLARHKSARAAVAAFDAHPTDYNPAWIMVGDADSLFYLDFTHGERAAVTELPPGVHVLENFPLGEPSPKVERIRAAVRKSGGDISALEEILRSHEPPPACVHAGPYGTRTAAIFVPPRVRYTDGPPCQNEFVDFLPFQT
jgi:uncharacterized protein with NRDE domain